MTTHTPQSKCCNAPAENMMFERPGGRPTILLACTKCRNACEIAPPEELEKLLDLAYLDAAELVDLKPEAYERFNIIFDYIRALQRQAEELKTENAKLREGLQAMDWRFGSNDELSNEIDAILSSIPPRS